MNVSRIRSRQSGASLIELLVGALIGMLILGVIASLYFANRSVFRFQESYSRIQETGRYVSEKLGIDIRNATYTGCGALTSMSNIVSGNTTNWWLNTDRMIWGYDQGTAVPSELSGTVADSDVLVLMYRSVSSEFMIRAHDLVNKRITTSALHTFAKGTLLLATDCSRSGVFRMSNSAAGPSSTIEYASGAISDSYDNNAAAVFSPVKLASGGFVSPMVTNAYYVMASNNAAFTTNPCPSDDATWVRRVLVVRTLAGSTNGETQAPRAVACDVQAFQVRFGLDNDGDLSADEFRTATDLGTTQALWQRVVSVRVDFLVVNPKPNTRDSDQR